MKKLKIHDQTMQLQDMLSLINTLDIPSDNKKIMATIVQDTISEVEKIAPDFEAGQIWRNKFGLLYLIVYLEPGGPIGIPLQPGKLPIQCFANDMIFVSGSLRQYLNDGGTV